MQIWVSYVDESSYSADVVVTIMGGPHITRFSKIKKETSQNPEEGEN
jgi:hypothetical protein